MVGNCLVDANNRFLCVVCVRYVCAWVQSVTYKLVGLCGFVRCWDKPSAY